MWLVESWLMINYDVLYMTPFIFGTEILSPQNNKTIIYSYITFILLIYAMK